MQTSLGALPYAWGPNLYEALGDPLVEIIKMQWLNQDSEAVPLITVQSRPWDSQIVVKKKEKNPLNVSACIEKWILLSNNFSLS